MKVVDTKERILDNVDSTARFVRLVSLFGLDSLPTLVFRKRSVNVSALH